jgi:formylglycine-generating enzyme required for sulfatase activity
MVSEVGWTSENSGESKAVGTKAANELGIYDMSGNVFEWCEDAYNSSRRIRGGGWKNRSDFAAFASRDFIMSENDRSGSVGFRLARSSGN